MASPCTFPHCRCSSSRLHLPGPSPGSEGYWALADESATGQVHGSGFPCIGGQSPGHVKSRIQTDERSFAANCGLPAEFAGVTFMPQRATSSENETRSRSPNGVAVQHLNRTSENDRFLDLDMVGIELLE